MTSHYKSWHYLIEALAHGVLISDNNGEILYVNEFAAKLFGRTPNELIGTIFSYPVATNETQEIEIIQPDGQTLTIKMAVKKGAWENLYAWIISLEDINTLKLNEKLLDLSSTAFNSAIEGIIITDGNLLLLQANKSFLSMTGYCLEDILGKSPKSFLQSGLQDDNFYHTLWERLNKTGHWSGEILDTGKNNEELPMFLSITTVQNNDGDITNYIGFFYDLRESKKRSGEN